MSAELLAALGAAARKKGSPLSDGEKQTIAKSLQYGTREQLRERFHKVILGAGYPEPGATRILNRHFDEYMDHDVPEFVKMLVEYETKNFSREDE